MVKLPQNAFHDDAEDDDLDPDDAAPVARSRSAKPERSQSEKAEAAPIVNGPAVPVMTGTHFHALDEKGRIIIPAKLRPALTEHFWMMLDGKDNISIYNYQTGLDILEYLERMMAEKPDDEEIAAAVMRTTEAMEPVSIEGGWRVLVPELLRFRAGLDKEVVTVGGLNHAVVWARDKWEDNQTERMDDPGVRKMQATMLRAAASSIKRASIENTEVTAAHVEEKQQADVATGTEGRTRSAGTASAAPTAPAGDGKRSARVLTLSQLGRSSG